MANNSVLPNCLANYHLTAFITFLYVKSTKQPRKTKMEIFINESKTVASVYFVFVNVLLSITHGLIAQMSDFLMHCL